MQICSYAYFQDMQGLDVTLMAKLFLFRPLRHMGTGCNAESKFVSLHATKRCGVMEV